MSDYKENPLFRRANFEDVPEIARRLRKLWGKIEPAYHGIKWDHPSALLTIDHAIRIGICLVGPTSCAGAVISPFLWNHNEMVADIMFWSFERSHEVTILNEISAICTAAGATHIKANTHWPDNRIGRFYMGKGFGPSETSWLLPSDKCCNGVVKGLKPEHNVT